MIHDNHDYWSISSDFPRIIANINFFFFSHMKNFQNCTVFSNICGSPVEVGLYTISWRRKYIFSITHKNIFNMKFIHFNLLIPVLLAIAIVAAAYSIDNQDLDDFFEGQVLGSVDSDEVSYKEFGDFINEWKDYYGYNNTIDDIRAADTKRFKGAAYFDYTGSGVYRESAVRKCLKELENNLFGNAHSRNPSSMLTENNVCPSVLRYPSPARQEDMTHLSFPRLRMLVTWFSSSSELIPRSILWSSLRVLQVRTCFAIRYTVGGLHLVGESFPWSKNSKFYYLHQVFLSFPPSFLEPQLRSWYSRICLSLWCQFHSHWRRNSSSSWCLWWKYPYQ